MIKNRRELLEAELENAHLELEGIAAGQLRTRPSRAPELRRTIQRLEDELGRERHPDPADEQLARSRAMSTVDNPDTYLSRATRCARDLVAAVARGDEPMAREHRVTLNDLCWDAARGYPEPVVKILRAAGLRTTA